MDGLTKAQILQPYLDKYPDQKLVEAYCWNLHDPLTGTFPLDPVRIGCCGRIFERAVVKTFFRNRCPIHHKPTKYRELPEKFRALIRKSIDNHKNSLRGNFATHITILQKITIPLLRLVHPPVRTVLEDYRFLHEIELLENKVHRLKTLSPPINVTDSPPSASNSKPQTGMTLSKKNMTIALVCLLYAILCYYGYRQRFKGAPIHA